MMLTEAYKLYNDIWELRDKRMDNYFLLGSPFSTLFLCSLYIIFSVRIGPWIMKNRTPYNLKKAIITYNISMVVINAYIQYKAWTLGWAGKYKLICEPVDTSNNPEALEIANLVYMYYITKYMDWLDTLFFILRKKFTHVSVLHLFHHSIMPINTWPVVRFLPGGQMTLIGLVNTFIHVIMYSYYALAALKPDWQKYFWWKKYITLLQMTQFIVGFPMGIAVIYADDCYIPNAVIYGYAMQGVVFLILFGNFYTKAYKKPLLAVNGIKKHKE